jgi:hypothetical protein
MLRLRTLTLLIIAALGGMLAWHHITDYRESEPYRCDAPAAARYGPPYVPLVGQYFFLDSLELYVVGWIERGTVRINGDDLPEPLEFSATDGPAMISHSRMGEWYQPDYTLRFAPSEGARCHIRAIYRFRGVF